MIRKILHRLNPFRTSGRAVFAVLLACNPMAQFSLAQDIEIKPLGLLDMGGFFSARYVSQSQESQSQFDTQSLERLDANEQEVGINALAYVYHPGFLNMDLGTGLINTQQDIENAFGTSKESEVLVNYNARLNFLSLKTYPFSIYTRRRHPSLITNLSGRILTQNDDHGLDWRLSGLGKLGVFRFSLRSYKNAGSGFGSVVDESGDETTVIWRGRTPVLGQIDLEHRDSRRLSASGSLGLPIRNRDTDLSRTSVGATNIFGDSGRLRVTHNFARLDQVVTGDILSDVTNYSYSLRIRDQWSDSILLNANYELNDSKRSLSKTRSNVLGAGLSHSVTDRLHYSLNAQQQDSRQAGFAKESLTIGGRVDYSIESKIGDWRIGVDHRASNSDQVSARETVPVFDELITLRSTQPVDLANDFVERESIVVRNLTGTQVYVEELDYRVIIVGATTSIQRFIDGNIIDGETVLVDYRYATGGTATYRQSRSNVSTAVNFSKYISARLTYGVTDTEVSDGELTRPTNDSDTLEAVINARLPGLAGWSLSAELRHADRREEISPSVRDSVQINVSTRIRGGIAMSMSAGLVQIDNENSIENTDQFNGRLNLSGTILNRILVDYSLSYMDDDGGSIEREQHQHRLSLQWRYRSVSFVLRGLWSEDILGSTSRRYKSVNAEFRRIF